MTSKRDLALEVSQLRTRVAELEQQARGGAFGEPYVGLVPDGVYPAEIVSAEKRVSQLGRKYWSLKVRLTEQYRGKPLWTSYVDRSTSRIEDMARDLGVRLERSDPFAEIEWAPGHDPESVFRSVPCRVRVRESRYARQAGRPPMNEVVEVLQA